MKLKKLKKIKIGCISDFTCFSFQAIKHLTTADGGLVCCKTKKDETFLKKIRWFGINRFSKRKLDGSRNNEDIKLIGYKYHLNNYSAALGLANLKKSKQILNHHISIGNYYTKKLNNINGIKILKFIDNRIHTFWFYQILVKNRKKFIKLLNEINFPCSIVDKRIDKNTIFRTYSRKLKNQDIFEKKKIALPVNMEIKKKHIDKLANYLRKNYQI
jgi:perosamine synthetase